MASDTIKLEDLWITCAACKGEGTVDTEDRHNFGKKTTCTTCKGDRGELTESGRAIISMLERLGVSIPNVGFWAKYGKDRAAAAQGLQL